MLPLERLMTANQYTHLLSFATRIAYNEQEAHDLLQEALVVAIKEDRLDFSLEDDIKWLVGVMRNKALQEARTVSRRRNRDHHFSSEQPQEIEATQDESATSAKHALNTLLDKLSPAARKVAVLVIHGLGRTEICTLLGVSDVAFRQRLTSIRKALGPLPPKLQQEVIALAYASRKNRGKDTNLPIGLIRKALLKSLKKNINEHIQSIGTHDPSGHLIVVTPSNRKK